MVPLVVFSPSLIHGIANMRAAYLSLFALVWLPVFALAAPVDYRKDIKPILQERCYACHGALAQKAKLRVDSRANMLKANVFVPGKPGDSELMSRIASKEDAQRMPPEGHALKPEQIEKIRAWISEGALTPPDDKAEPDPRDHWSFRPVIKPAVLDSKTQNPIDAFIAAEWRNQQLKSVAPADKRVLLRRVYLDLIGLPPTAEQTEAFVKDTNADAYEKVVDTLLASPQYGEQWGRHFLDIWRYSDWWGLGAELRNSQRHIWHWRDWAIESFNADLGYDEMIRQMLAADELYPTDANKLRATGYLARSYFLFNRTSWLDEVVEHTGKGFLGITLNCAKCHDHKYDPIKQTDYYQFRAIFEPYQVRTDLLPGEPDAMKAGIPRAFDCNLEAKTPFHIRGDERNPDKDRLVLPGLPQFLAPDGLKISAVKLPPVAYRPGARSEIVAGYKKAAEAKLATAKATLTTAKDGAEVAAQAAIAAAEAELAAIDARAAAILAGTKETAKAAAKAEATLGLSNAELALARAQAELLRAAPAAKAASEKKAKAAEALVEKAKKTVETSGETFTPIPGTLKSAESNVDRKPKTGPFPDTSSGRRTALANWIAHRQNPLTARVAVNHVWLRHFGKPLVANVFEFGRKGTAPTHPELLDWLAAEFMDKKWSFKQLHKIIVTSDVYRLSSSAANADANEKIDPENRYLWRMNPVRMEAQAIRDSLLHLAGELDLTMSGPPVPAAAQDASRRRSLYFFHSHNEHNKLLDTFDNANVLDCYRRSESIVPQQALALWNSKLAMTSATKINDRILAKLGVVEDAFFVTAAFQSILGTTPTKEELAICLESLTELRDKLKDVKEADRSKRARLQLILALINHNDFVTMR